MRFRFSILGIGFSFGNYSIKPDENLAGRDLRGRYFAGANLRGRDLRGANLAGTNLRGRDLRGANLTNALGVPLRREGSNLASANLLGANPAGMTIREWAAKQKAEENQNVLRRWLGANLTGATMPDGTIHE